MRRITTLTLLLFLTLTIRAQERSVINQVSGKPEIAPEAMATITGLSLDVQPEQARTLRRLPLSLAGVTVTVDGRIAALRYVGRREIVFIAPRLPIRYGRESVVVTIHAPGEEISLPVALAYNSPGLLCYGQPRDGCAPQAIYRQGKGMPLLMNELPVDLFPETVVQFFGTGFRRADVRTAEVKLCGEMPLEILYIGPDPFVDGMDVVTVKLPTRLPASCSPTEQAITLSVAGRVSNSVAVSLRDQ